MTDAEKKIKMAKLLYVLIEEVGISQVEAAKKAGIGRNTVTNWKNEALDEGWLFEPKPYYRIPPRILADALDDLGPRKSLLEDRILLYTGRRVVVRVYPTPAAPVDYREQTRHLATLAAPYLSHLIAYSDHCGVSWGGSVNSMVEAILERYGDAPPPEGSGPELFIPVIGEPVGGDSPPSYSSSDVAARLSRLYGCPDPPDLRGAPALVPSGFVYEDFEENYLHKIKSWTKIFADRPDNYIGKLDTLITSAGAQKGSLMAGEIDLLSDAGLRNRRISLQSNGIIGDMAGILFDQNGIAPLEGDLAGFIKRWTGLKKDHLIAIRDNADASNGKKPGIALTVASAAKAPITRAIILAKLPGHLIIDEELEKALLEMLPVP